MHSPGQAPRYSLNNEEIDSMNDSMAKALDEEAAATGASEKSGRAVFTEDGRTVWEWQTATGVFSQLSTAEQFARLDAAKLELVETPQEARQRWTGQVAHNNAQRSKPQSRKSAPKGLQALFSRLAGQRG